MKQVLWKTLSVLVCSFAFAANVEAENLWVKVKNGTWEPNRQMLGELKASIRQFVTNTVKTQDRELKEWHKYTFQYRGETKNGKSFILVNAVCGVRNEALDQEMVLVLDGGSCYFNLKYDPVKKAFFELLINGEA